MEPLVFEEPHMGTRVTLTVYGAAAGLDRRVAEAFGVFAGLEDRFSLFRPGSEIRRVNSLAGSGIAVSPAFARMLGRALSASERTGGLFSPFVGAVTAAVPAVRGPVARRPSGFLFDEDRGRLIMPPGSALDLNAIVKGAAIDAAMAGLGGGEPALIEAGGDLLARGTPPGRGGWAVGIRDPFGPEKIVTVIRVGGGAVCTSGDYFRRGRPHLVDPRTGTETGPCASVTVAAATAEEADILSTAACFLEPSAAVEFIESRGAAALVIDRRRAILAGPAMKQLLEANTL